MKKSIVLFLTVFCIVAMSACQSSVTETPIEITVSLPTDVPPPPPTETPNLRTLDGMVMVHVPAGEFEMGSDEEQVERAAQTCGEYRDGCPPNWFTDEQPAHTVELDAF